MTDTVMIERALMVIAACAFIQTVAIGAGVISAFIAWHRTKLALESRFDELRARVDRVSENVEHATHAFEQSVGAVHDAVDGTREAVRSAAAFVASPKSAIAFGALRGLHWWRQYRAQRRASTIVGPSRLVVPNRS